MSGTAAAPRLCVYRSLNHIYAQIIDDTVGNTLVAASTLDKAIKADLAGKTKSEEAKLVGELLAKKALEKGSKRSCSIAADTFIPDAWRASRTARERAA